MILKQNYEIYCLYHNQVFSEYYGNQIDKVTFVKMDRGSYVFPAKKHIHLVEEPWFHPIGKEWVEYEFYYSLYKGHLKGEIELPEYLGFIQYDMEFSGKEEKYKNISVIDFIEDCFAKNMINPRTIISFQPLDFMAIYNQNFILDRSRPYVVKDSGFENCIDTMIRENNEMLDMKVSFDKLKSRKIFLSGSFFIHKYVFLEIMSFLNKLITKGNLSMFDDRFKGGCCAGDYAERYIALYLETLDLNKIEFNLFHHFVTSSRIEKVTSNFINSLFGIIGILLKKNTPNIYKILKPYFPDKK